MQRIYSSLRELDQLLTTYEIPYAVFGGLSVAVWGEPRLTRDIDVKVMLSREQSERLLEILQGKYEPVGEDPLEMLKRNGILFALDSSSMRVDFHLCDTEFDRQAIERAIDVAIAPGINVKMCSAEDLIVYKMVSTRVIDAHDYESVIARQRSALDDQYVIQWLSRFEKALDDSTLVHTYMKLRKLSGGE